MSRPLCVHLLSSRPSLSPSITANKYANKESICLLAAIQESILREAANNESICLLAAIQESILREAANKESICLLAAI